MGQRLFPPLVGFRRSTSIGRGSFCGSFFFAFQLKEQREGRAERNTGRTNNSSSNRRERNEIFKLSMLPDGVKHYAFCRHQDIMLCYIILDYVRVYGTILD